MSQLTQSLHPAYHLRPNKAIDRSIFIELLHVFDRYESLNKHVYIGLGGPFLEDFRLMSKEFPKMSLMSIEKETETFKRQKFHQCTRNIKLQNCSFKDFLSSQFPTHIPTITWADYTDFSRQVLLETSNIARSAIPLSIIRITVKAETPLYRELNLGGRKPSDMPPRKEKEFKAFLAEFRQDFNLQDVAYDEALFKWASFTFDKYPLLIARLIYSVITSACTYPKVYLPLHSVMYSDGTIMLSITGLFCLEEHKARIIDHFRSKSDFFSHDPSIVETIDVPMLTTKERLHLECEIPADKEDGTVAATRLGYSVEGNNLALNQKKMKQYEKYHRLYPYFGKLIP